MSEDLNFSGKELLLLVFCVAQQTGCQKNKQSANQGDGKKGD
jgi:hypothetical protein